MTVSEQIIQVMDALCEKFGIAVDWTSKNVIPYVEILCKKLITYEITTSIFWIVIMILMSIGSVVATKKLTPMFKNGLKENKRNYECGWEIGTFFAIAGLIILSLTTIIVVAVQIMDIIKCVTFPEMYAFEYISVLIQQ
jgi:hypothetical protein